MNVTTFLYGLDIVFLSYLALDYYRTSYRVGYMIDLWQFQILLKAALPTLILFPFSSSDLNVVALGGLLSGAQEKINQAFTTSVIGLLALYCGAFLWRVKIGLGLRRRLLNTLSIIPNASQQLAHSRLALGFHTLLALSLEGLCLLIYFSHNGFGFNFHSVYGADPSLRALANFVLAYSSIVGSHCLIRYLHYRDKLQLAATIALVAGLLFFGVRGAILAMFDTVIISYFVSRGRRIGLLKVLLTGGLLMILVFYLDGLRYGRASLFVVLAEIGFMILYGNTFSDLRDFAVVLSQWDGHYLAGKTYLAALFTFLPRALSPFRDQWAIGVVTATIAGFNPDEHPGLRPGQFGEVFLNFGLWGVIALGLVFGVILKQIDRQSKAAFQDDSKGLIVAFSWANWIIILDALCISVVFIKIYILLFVFGSSILLIKIAKVLSGERPRNFTASDGQFSAINLENSH
jgi:oligosaccharide repeat unit polymerase